MFGALRTDSPEETHTSERFIRDKKPLTANGPWRHIGGKGLELVAGDGSPFNTTLVTLKPITSTVAIQLGVMSLRPGFHCMTRCGMVNRTFPT